ncbi:MAG: hypothetical protein GX260_00025 [Tissierellia bacterium]|nr:peptidylprolyl isomerase [Bacillota bacterium]NLL22152.1 hypothetical protein [Tissierellia bacterium]
MKKRWLALLLIGVLLLGACAKTTDNEEYIAKVGDTYLLKKTYNGLVALNKYILSTQYGAEILESEDQGIIIELKQATLEDLVTGALVEKMAQERGIPLDEEEVARIEGEFLQTFENDENLPAIFEKEGAEASDLFPYIRMQSYFSSLLDVWSKEAEETQAYEQLLVDTVLVRARHILLDGEDEAAANELLDAIKADPSTFHDVAVEKSNDPGSASRGGELGYFERGDMVSEFGDASFGAEVGDIVMTRSQFGFHIIEILDRGTIAQLEEKGLESEVEQKKKGLLNQVIGDIIKEEMERVRRENPVEYYDTETIK